MVETWKPDGGRGGGARRLEGGEEGGARLGVGGEPLGVSGNVEADERPGEGVEDLEEDEKVLLVEREEREVEVEVEVGGGGEGQRGVAAIAARSVGRQLGELRVDGRFGEHLDVRREGQADVLHDGELDDARRTLQDRKPRAERVVAAVEHVGALNVIGVLAGLRSETAARPERSPRAETEERSGSTPPDANSLRFTEFPAGTWIACRRAAAIEVSDEQRVVERGKRLGIRGYLQRAQEVIAVIHRNGGGRRGESQQLLNLQLGADYASGNARNSTAAIAENFHHAVHRDFQGGFVGELEETLVETCAEFYRKRAALRRHHPLDHQIRLAAPAVERFFLELGGERSVDPRAAELLGFPRLGEGVEGKGGGEAVQKVVERIEKCAAERSSEE